jgi:Flp pilus assembly protein TadG
MFRKDEEGQALVETALSVALFAVLIFGAGEFGRLAFAAIEVNNAAKAAAQYGAQSRGTATDTVGMLAAAQSEYFTTGLTLVSPTSTSGYACSCSDGTSPPSTTCGTADTALNVCSGSNLEVTMTVETQATFNSVLHIPGFPASYTLTGIAVQKVLQ